MQLLPRLGLFVLLLIASIDPLTSQVLLERSGLIQDERAGDGIIKISQRYNVRRRVDNNYQGLFYGNQLIIMEPVSNPSQSGLLRADYLIGREEKVDPTNSPKELRDSIQARFVLANDGVISNESLPLPAGPAWIPRVPNDLEIKAGKAWKIAAFLMLDPLGDGGLIKVPVLVEYTILGLVLWNKRQVIEVKGKYAVRMPRFSPLPQNPEVSGLFGTRDVQLYLDAKDLQPVFARETLGKETVTYRDGKTVLNEGFVLTFYQGIAPFGERREREQLVEQVTKRIEDQEFKDIRIRKEERGTVLELENLRFVADQAVLLSGEEERLDTIAALLKTVASSSLLVQGHTAAVGDQASQLSLSLERARKISAELLKRGIAPDRLLIEGKGGSVALATNETEEGRAKNRRVEIIILKD